MSYPTGQDLERSGSGALRWLRRTLYTVVGAALLVTSFFFIEFALIAGLLLALAIAVRIWWMTRALRSARNARVPLEGQYVVVDGNEDSAAALIVDGRKPRADHTL